MKWKEIIKKDLGKDVEDLLSQMPRYLSADIATKPLKERQKEIREAINKYPDKAKEIEEEYDSKAKKVKKALKAHCGTEKMGCNCATCREKTNKALSPKQKRLDRNKNGKLDAEDFRMLREGVKKNIEEEILEEVEDEGGALGMKNLKDIADKKKLKETLSSMEDRKVIFEHEDGDFYTHKPKRRKKGD